ncbi:hypothetical protein FRC10_003720 [Ceratobasidium sp. 414]|nr:hypothetical protein FRC10_003720 [Ceratobasidium sp. 414]
MPESKHARTDDDTPPVAGPSRLPDPDPHPVVSATDGADRGDVNGCMRNGVFVDKFPIKTAGSPIGAQCRRQADLKEYLESCGRLGDRDLLETAEIMMTTGLTGKWNKKLKKMRNKKWKGKEKEVWPDDAALLRDVDRLPTGPNWTTANVSVGEGSHERVHTVYMRNILEVIQELLGARQFKHVMRYAPERHWTSRDRKCRVYDEMWSGDWWWRMQNKNGTIAPLIVATDETTMSNNPRGAKAHPVYLSLGNISKDVRRKPTKRSMIVIGYLPVDSFNSVQDTRLSDKTRRRYRMELLHRSLGKIFEPLKTASSDGMLAWCADGYIRHVYPMIAAWVADWPEQNDIAGTTQSGCPKCMQIQAGQGQGGLIAPLRDQSETLEAFQAYHEMHDQQELDRLDLRPVRPFWSDIPNVDFGRSLTPDLLHQLYKGMYEHARDWVENLLGMVEFNRHFKAMPPAQDLRRFKKGVTKVKVWAGRESRDMMRQFLPVIIDAQAPPKFIQLIRALLDFSYIAHGAQLTEAELVEMDKALAAFHEAKYVLQDERIMAKESGFDRIPKLHMLGHWTQDICELGTPDGYSTETPEHLHILYVKIPWRLSNRRNPMPQIVKYARRLEALEMQHVLLKEYYGKPFGTNLNDLYWEGEEEDKAKREGEGEGEGDGEGEGEDGTKGDVDQGDVDGDEEDGDEGSDEDSNEDEERVEVSAPAESMESEIHYPRPRVSISQRPTVPRVPGHVIITSYGASDFIRAVRCFLMHKTTLPPGERLILLPSDRFHVWHKAALNHTALPFAPAQPCHHDTIRAYPPVRDTAGRVIKLGVFDTALFPHDRSGHGLQRRVRVIFSLPPRLEHIYSRPLAYVDTFTAFERDNTASRLYRTTPAYSLESPVSIVIPLTCLVMACHLPPDFSSPLMPVRHSDSPTVFSHEELLFNDFYNHNTFLLMAYWDRVGHG